MDIHGMSLLSHLLSAAFVVAWLVRLGLAVSRWVRRAWLHRLPTGLRISRYPPGLEGWEEAAVSLSGALFGWVLISWIGNLFVQEWLLLILPALALLCSELNLSKRDAAILAVYALITGLRDQREAGKDFFDRLARIVDGLPPGEVQRACRESLQRRRSGMPVDRSCQPLRRINPVLDEMVFTLGFSGWQAGLAFDAALDRLERRVGTRWDRLSRWMALREQIQPFLWFGQAAILTALLDLVVAGFQELPLAWASRAVLGWVGLGCLLAAGVLYLAHNQAWLRRPVIAVLLIGSLVPLWHSARLPRLYELRVDSITLFNASDHRTNKGQNITQARYLDASSSSANPENRADGNNSSMSKTSSADPGAQEAGSKILPRSYPALKGPPWAK